MSLNDQEIKSSLQSLGYQDKKDFLIVNKEQIKFISTSQSEIIGEYKNTIITNILKLLGITFKTDDSFEANFDNLKKLPKKNDLSIIMENFLGQKKKSPNNHNLDCLQYCATKVNSIILKPSLSTLDPQGSQINSSYFFENIWYNTKRGNSLRFAEGFNGKFQKYLKKDTEQDFKKIKEKNEDFFIGFFSKAFQEMEKKMSEKTQSFSWQDAINTLAIAKAFGGLSNIKKDGQNEGYKKISDSEFIAAIKLKFPEVIDFQSLDSAKLGQYKIFSKLYQKTTQDILKSNRGANNQTGLRLTFFPDHAIERLLGIKDTKANFKENIAQSAQIIDDFIKPKPKLMSLCLAF